MRKGWEHFYVSRIVFIWAYGLIYLVIECEMDITSIPKDKWKSHDYFYLVVNRLSIILYNINNEHTKLTPQFIFNTQTQPNPTINIPFNTIKYTIFVTV